MWHCFDHCNIVSKLALIMTHGKSLLICMLNFLKSRSQQLYNGRTNFGSAWYLLNYMSNLHKQITWVCLRPPWKNKVLVDFVVCRSKVMVTMLLLNLQIFGGLCHGFNESLVIVRSLHQRVLLQQQLID